MAAAEPSRYLQFLPAIFQKKDPDGKTPLLGPFLAPFEQQLAVFDEILAHVDRNFAAPMASEDGFLPWLAGWVAHLFDQEWDEDRRRRFLAAAMELYRWRGTLCGLQRYLELCLDLGPEDVSIKENRRPAGMQIGVASRIAGPSKKRRSDTVNGHRDGMSVESHDYFVVDTLTSETPLIINSVQIAAGKPLRVYYRADCVKRIQTTKDATRDGVTICYTQENPDGSSSLQERFHQRRDTSTPPTIPKPNIRRRNGLVDYVYTWPDGKIVKGGSFLIEDVETPYRFIVNFHGLRPFTAVKKPLFSTELDSTAELDAGVLPARFREEFKDPQPAVRIEQAGQRWLVVDSTQKYLIVKGLGLDVHRSNEEKPLFSLEASCAADLDAGVLPARFWEEFKDHGLSLNPQPAVRIEQAGQRWLVVDSTQKYPVVKGKTSLDVHRPNEEKPLFSLKYSCAAELDAGILSARSRREFERHGLTLSPKPEVQIEQPGQKWLVLDSQERSSPDKYLVVKTNLGSVYRFDERASRVRAILDAEKPAHTLYNLRATPASGKRKRSPMQIGVRSTVGFDTLVG